MDPDIFPEPSSTIEYGELPLSQRNWDQYFMAFARLAASNTKCGSRKIGAALVVDNRVVATGYNGPPEGMPRCSDRYRKQHAGGLMEVGQVKVLGPFEQAEGSPDPQAVPWPDDNFCPRRVLGYPSGKGLEICVAAHAERNALLQAARLGIRTEGATLYCWCGQVCKDCAIEIVNAGVAELVFLSGQPVYDDLASEILENSCVLVRTIPDLTDDVFFRVM